MRLLGRWCKWASGALIAGGLLYVVTALILGLVPGRARPVTGPADYLFFACDNGVHVDIVLPVTGGGRDWFDYFPASDFAGDVTGASHLMFGWGARGFFATTKEWRDIRPAPVFRALLWLDRSVLHVTYAGDPRGRANCREIATDQAGAQAMFRFIDQTFDPAADPDNGLAGSRPQREALPGYGLTDGFYAARGRYSLFRTCNVWSAELLRESGQEMALWSPFSFQVMGLLASP